MATEYFTADGRACTACGCVKPTEEFSKNKNGYKGRASECRQCKALRNAIYREKDLVKREALKQDFIKKRAAAKDEIRRLRLSEERKFCPRCSRSLPVEMFSPGKSRTDGRRGLCRECNNAANREYRERHPEAAARSSNNWSRRNPERVRAKAERWNKKNPGKLSRLAAAWARRKRSECPVFRLKTRTRNCIVRAFSRKGYRKNSSTYRILGCDWETLKDHIEKQFAKGMTWENMGEWHIDHIVPLAEASNEEDVIRLNHFTNLRPLWAKENLKKGRNRLFLV